MRTVSPVASLSDDALLARVGMLVERERHALADLIAALGEVDARKHGRCPERGFLELHHVVPFADGGPATAGNIQLRCRAHNQHEADLWDGANIVKNRPPGYASP